MASPDTASVDLPIPVFGGRVTQYDPQTLPVGASPFNQDVVYSGQNPFGSGLVQGVATRPGMQAFYGDVYAGNPTVNYLKTFVDSQGIFHLLSLDGLGNFRDESPCPTPPGAFGATVGHVVAASLAQSDSLINREWIAFSNAAHPGFGIDIPRQWDGTNFDRVSQVGPGEAPVVNNYAPSATILAAPTGILPIQRAILALTKVGSIVTVTMSVPVLNEPPRSLPGDIVQILGNGGGYDGTYTVLSIVQNGDPTIITLAGPAGALAPSAGGNYIPNTYVVLSTGSSLTAIIGDRVVIAAATDPTYDGTWEVRRGGNNNQVLYIPTGSGVASGDGSITLLGNIPAGKHLVSVSFVTREQYITKPAPFNYWIALGSNKAMVTGIPIGPPNVIARILMFTPVVTPPAIIGPFFYFDGDLVIPGVGQYPTMVIQDNTTTSYLVDFDDSTLINSTPASNLFNLLELGESASVQSYSNRLFWAGERNKVPNFLNLTFDGGFDGVRPLGWKLDVTNGAGGSKETGLVWWGDAYRITGNGSTIAGLITQPAYQDYLGVPIIQINTGYSVRVRLAKGGGIVAGNAVIELFGGGGSLGTFSVPVANIGAAYSEFIGVIMASRATMPTDTVLRVYLSGTPTVGGYVLFETIELFPTKQPYNRPLVRGSYAGDPESYDQLTGYMIIGQATDQSVRCMFVLLDNKLYMVTERGIYVTTDDGTNEPSLWTISTVSATVGTGSIHGVGVGVSWAVVAAHDGAYIFWGGEPVKISQEIQPDWDRINWAFDQTIYVVVDTANKRVHIGAPIDGATKPNVEFVMDYSKLASVDGMITAQEIASNKAAPGMSRKWTMWNLSMNIAALTIRSDESYHLLRGNGVGNGKIYDQVISQLSDDGAAINSQYQIAFFPQVGLGNHRRLCKYLAGYAFGVGTLSFTMYAAQQQRALPLSNLTLTFPERWDFEKNVNFVAERMSLLFGTNLAGSWFEMAKLCLTLQKEIITPVKGVY